MLEGKYQVISKDAFLSKDGTKTYYKATIGAIGESYDIFINEPTFNEIEEDKTYSFKFLLSGKYMTLKGFKEVK